MKKIKLTQNKFAIIDEEFYSEIIKYKWHTDSKNRKTNYASNRCTINMRMHRYIMQLAGFYIKNKQVDHINGNGLDNRLENLRIATKQQNNRNVSKRANNTTGYKGVVKDNRHNNIFYARITINNKSKHLGTFNNILDAAKCYNQAAIKYHGEFASLNNVS